MSFLHKLGETKCNLFNLTKLDPLRKEEAGLNESLSLSLKNLNLLFSFYIYKVDKHIYKNSRGKSGKFTFI